MFVNSLSGRFLLLTTVFVMLAEVLIFVPSIARFREDYLLLRLEKAQIASLALLANDMITDDLETELLENADVYNVVLRRDDMRQLVLHSELPKEISATFDLRKSSPFALVRDAVLRLFNTREQVIRVIGEPVRGAGLLIEVTMNSMNLRGAMLDYGLRILMLSAVISVTTAIMLFLAVRGFLLKPIHRVVRHIKSYAEAPQDARRIIEPNASVLELREAEEALRTMQTQLTGSLKQKEHLAQMGGAVAKISHDLRNILTTTQLFVDRMETSDDPMVQKAAPKLVNSLSRAVNLCESTLAFGKAEEAAPALTWLPLLDVVNDVIDAERLATDGYALHYRENIPADLVIRSDPEQLYRVISNIVRNARQAIVATGKAGEISITVREDEESWIISITDTGPGLPAKAREHLFTPFQGGVRKGGSGLGLSIAAELVRGHGGKLELRHSDAGGTVFEIFLPRGDIDLDDIGV
ncbi:MAG TPA: sensor histidine kinase [Rhodobacteraceae bacterium]|jgi:signal transduction histidine kinase|nr:sensor histidine kinase [Paracoccaceae bacterium]